jgi:hypothetical protein
LARLYRKHISSNIVYLLQFSSLEVPGKAAKNKREKLGRSYAVPASTEQIPVLQKKPHQLNEPPYRII